MDYAQARMFEELENARNKTDSENLWGNLKKYADYITEQKAVKLAKMDELQLELPQLCYDEMSKDKLNKTLAEIEELKSELSQIEEDTSAITRALELADSMATD